MAITRLGGANAITGTIPNSNLAAGNVIQVSDMVIITSAQTLTSATYTDLTSATINITPSSTSNKIILTANINAKYDAAITGYGIKFLRDSTSIFTTSQNYANYKQNDNDRLMQFWNYIDAPSSTSELTYKIQTNVHNSGPVIFQDSSQSTFYLMEIAG